MTFKIVPTDLDVKSEPFGKNPVTSGPFLLDMSRRSDETKRECLFFMANRKYSRRPSKRNAPRIQEVRFYTYSKPVEELQAGKLDLALDLTAGEVQELLAKQRTDRLAIEAPLPSLTVPNRRIYFLAVNHRKVADARLRRALAFAINREALLDRHFRGPLKGLHRALNGPFPAGSWACNPDRKAQHLFDAGQAKTWSVGVEKPDDLKLKYPQGDPVLDEAMTDLCAQVKTLTGVVLEPKPCDPYQLREDVELTGRYDLAYYHYDFPDESYWLAPLLGPPPRSDGSENMFHFNNGEITKLLVGMESYRDFAMVRKYQWEMHKLILEELPFIPLWQLDPLLAYRRDVEPSAIDPLLVFNNIEEWRLHRR